MKSLGRVPTDPVPHYLVRDWHSCRSRFSLSVADLDNSFSTSKVAICSRLYIGLEARYKKKEKKLNENILKENDSSYGITDLRF